ETIAIHVPYSQPGVGVESRVRCEYWITETSPSHAEPLENVHPMAFGSSDNQLVSPVSVNVSNGQIVALVKCTYSRRVIGDQLSGDRKVVRISDSNCQGNGLGITPTNGDASVRRDRNTTASEPSVLSLNCCRNSTRDKTAFGNIVRRCDPSGRT